MAETCKILKGNIHRLIKEIKAAAKRRREDSTLPYKKKIDLLKKGILNVPHHVFGIHTQISVFGGWPCTKDVKCAETQTDDVVMTTVVKDVDVEEKPSPVEIMGNESNDETLKLKKLLILEIRNVSSFY